MNLNRQSQMQGRIRKKASAGKGKKYAEAVVAKYALLFEELVHKELY